MADGTPKGNESSSPDAVPLRPRILLVDDDATILTFFENSLKAEYDIDRVESAVEALKMVKERRYDTIVVDLVMPGMDGLSFLRSVRELDPDLPVMLASGAATLETALKALEYGAFRFLTKPVEVAALRGAVAYGVRLARMASIKRQALEVLGAEKNRVIDRKELNLRFENALGKLWMAYQPIVSWKEKNVYAYEALVRTDEQSVAGPGPLFDAAERLGRVIDLGRSIRKNIAGSIAEIPMSAQCFVNLHPSDLDDPDLYDPSAPLSRVAERVVLEMSERASLDTVRDARPRIASLRKMGFRIAIDDLGAGHAGLSTFTQLEPDVVKLDMSLVRGADREPTKRKLIRSMTGLCLDLKMLVIMEGVETPGERDACVNSGCDLLQGYLFGKPTRSVQPAVFVA